jgi:carboxyl-terminal processing protease
LLARFDFGFQAKPFRAQLRQLEFQAINRFASRPQVGPKGRTIRISPEEFKQFLASQKREYAGIGMYLALNAAGKVICRPYLGSPATEAGIVLGDELKTVDGRPVAEQSILTLAGQIRGEVGTEIQLTVLNARDGERTLTVNRKQVQSQSVEIVQQLPVPILRMMAFTQNTVQELRDVFNQLQLNTNLILDLRGNPGGSLYDAIDAAKLFLREDVKVVGVRKQGKIHEYRSAPHNALPEITLYIWQDASTASAAEVFIAALTQNQYALSIGPTTYGKGKVQEVIPLSDGSALYMTTQDLQTPDGNFYHGRGIVANITLKPNENKTQNYMLPVIRLITQHAAHSAFRSNRPHQPPASAAPTPPGQPAVPAVKSTPLKPEPQLVSPPAVSPLDPKPAK